jgi:hypothetical protein
MVFSNRRKNSNYSLLLGRRIVWIYIIISLFCVWPAIDSVPGGHVDMRPVSLEPVGPEGVQREKNFPEKWPVAKLPNKNIMPIMLFNGKIYIYIYICVHFEQAHF